MTHNRIKNSNFINELKKSMAKNINIQVTDNLTDNFRGYAALLRKIKQRVLIAQQRVIYAANEEMLRMYWDVGEMLQQSQDADGWGKKTLQRLAVDLKNDYSEIKGFTVRNMQYMVQSLPITGRHAICKKPSNLMTTASMERWQTTSLNPCLFRKQMM